jgi:FkbM family methyltransferase
MPSPDTPFAIVLPTIYGRMIVNRHDSNRANALLKTGRAPDHGDIATLSNCLRLRGGQGMVVDVGSNVGTHSLAFAAVIGEHRMVHAFEPQRIIFNMLCGSVALNGVMNVHCHNVALGDRDGRIAAPPVDYSKPFNFGAVEFGRALGADVEDAEYVRLARLDSFQFDSVALLKIDVEGMEMQVLDGAMETIRRTRPILYIEYHMVDRHALKARIESWGYSVYTNNINYLCIPSELADAIPVQVSGAA